MKRLFIILTAAVMAVGMMAQEGVTKFLGIPVDGFKSEMIQKLKAKGYQYNATNDYLTGEFNGRDVNIFIVTNNNKVYRIMVADANYMSEGDIRIRFNTLCRQFEKNNRYFNPTFEDYTISESEDISYEMTVNNKRYQASYLQLPQNVDSASIAQETIEFIRNKYGSEEAIAKMTEDEKINVISSAMVHLIEKYSDNSVWFMISERYGRYGILLYYDNKKNQANGEDL